MRYRFCLPLLLAGLFSSAQADEGQWFVRPYVGYSLMSDQTGQGADLGQANGAVSVDLDGGFAAGLGLGYRYNANWAVELAWEYRSNDSTTTLASGERFDEGNFASNLFFLNGFYFFDQGQKWVPYLGAGISWAQEVDLDLEQDGIERSFSGDGEFGYQAFAGIEYRFSPTWSLQGEVRYGALSGLTLEGEQEAGRIEDIDYHTTTFQIALRYAF
ncbi:outer membrane protein [Ferrimonas marina]|uniref:Opacity protein n=1 Tax=Ferrimonas marina TaxID=299255 RepID=A0A1M5XU66_9GAMM|nr:OmpW family outer membrane protein [Ferrimonas marina]SHI03262.1 Opacity protein [Ferrimonas marina]